MRQQVILTGILTAILLSAIVIKYLYFPQVHGYGAYFFLSVYWICSILILIFAFNLTWARFLIRKKSDAQNPESEWANRRNTFRIIYPAFLRPVLVVEEIDDLPVRNLEFPVMDLSQGGICFLDDGSLGPMDRFKGYIRIDNGDRIPVAGSHIRKTGSQVSIQFQHAVDWSTLLNEQRRLLALMKPAQAGS